MTHGEIIKRALEVKNITPAELSRISTINRHTIYTIINKNQNKTNANIYKPIALALNLPEDIFVNSENLSLAKLDSILFSSLSENNSDNKDMDLLELMEKYNRTPKFILDGLKYVSFYSKYSEYDISTLLVNAYKYDVGLYNYIENLIKYGLVVTKTEYHIIEGFRLLDQNEQHLLYDVLTQLIGSHYFFSKDGSTTQKPVENDKIDMMSWTPSWKVDE